MLESELKYCFLLSNSIIPHYNTTVHGSNLKWTITIPNRVLALSSFSTSLRTLVAGEIMHKLMAITKQCTTHIQMEFIKSLPVYALHAYICYGMSAIFCFPSFISQQLRMAWMHHECAHTHTNTFKSHFTWSNLSNACVNLSADEKCIMCTKRKQTRDAIVARKFIQNLCFPHSLQFNVISVSVCCLTIFFRLSLMLSFFHCIALFPLLSQAL